jgi:hypothetical protein
VTITYAERFCRAKKAETTANLAREIYGSSFALDEAIRLPKEAREAAITIADSYLPLNSDRELVAALMHFGYRASAFARYLDGIRAYAANRRSMS